MSAKCNNNLHRISLFYFCVYVFVCVWDEGGRKVGGVQGGFILPSTVMLTLAEALWSCIPSWTWQTYFPLWSTVAWEKMRQERMLVGDRTSVSGS